MGALEPARLGRAGDEVMGDWIAFWDSEHSIYVNARHRDVHYRTIGQDIGAHLPAAAAVLDYGCGEALHADLIATSARALILCEAAPTVRAGLAARFADQSKIKVCSPEEVAALPAGSLDAVVLHSVAQYLTPQELDALLVLFRRLLSENGILILGGVGPPQVSAWTDSISLIRLGPAHRFLRATLIRLRRTLVSDYWRLRFDLGLSRYGEAAMLAKLAASGLSSRLPAAHTGHNRARITFPARRGRPPRVIPPPPFLHFS